jgi:predicted neutral ceramidase superfamily lipid hydrolase
MAQLPFVVSAFAVVMTGLPAMIQVLGTNQIAFGIRRGVLVFAFAFLGPSFLRMLVLPILICAFVWLKQVMFTALVVVLVAFAALALLRLLTKQKPID